jgi:hypothetical protein
LSQLAKIVIKRLEEKGIHSDIIPGFIRDLVNAISINPECSLQDLNSRLHFLGWDDFELDEHTLQLVIADFEAGGLRKKNARAEQAWI